MARRPRDHKPVKQHGRGIFRTQYRCCGKTMHSNRAQKAHHLAAHSGMWASDKARKAGRKMGKDLDKARRHAMGWLRAAGLRDQRGQLTAKARSRPQVRGRVGVRQLRKLHKHDRDHERADRHDREAERAAARGKTARQVDRHQRAANLRNRWSNLRPAPAPTARSNGRRPPPSRPAPGGRLAPQHRANGTRPRTRTP